MEIEFIRRDEEFVKVCVPSSVKFHVAFRFACESLESCDGYEGYKAIEPRKHQQQLDVDKTVDEITNGGEITMFEIIRSTV